MDACAWEGATTPEQGRLIARALGDCLIAAGFAREGALLSGPELLLYATELKEALSGPHLAMRQRVSIDPDRLLLIAKTGSPRLMSNALANVSRAMKQAKESAAQQSQDETPNE